MPFIDELVVGFDSWYIARISLFEGAKEQSKREKKGREVSAIRRKFLLKVFLIDKSSAEIYHIYLHGRAVPVRYGNRKVDKRGNPWGSRFQMLIFI